MRKDESMETYTARFYAGQVIYLVVAGHILRTFVSEVVVRSLSKESASGEPLPPVTTFTYFTRYLGETNPKYIFESVVDVTDYLKENIITHKDQVEE